MDQLYFLSIVFNGLCGFVFLFGDLGENLSDGENKKNSFFGLGFRLIVGILTGITGILKLLYPKNGPPILGDLVPAAVGIIAGFMLIYSFYRERATNVDSEEKVNNFGEIILHYRKAAGVIMLAVAALHFIFPKAFLL